MNNIIERVWNQGSMVTIEDLSGAAFQAESGGHTFRIRGVDKDGNGLTLSGTPSGVMLRADGQDVTLTCSVSGGVVTATLPANAYSVPGRFGITIFLTSDSQKTALYAAIGSVVKTSSGTVAPPAGSDVVDLINQINTAIAAIPVNYNASFAPAYSTSGLYSVGQYVTYDGNLYRCISTISSGESWTSSHWTQVALANEVCDLKSAFMRLENTKNLFIGAELVENHYYYAQPSGETTTYSYFGVNVENGKSYIFKSPVRFIGKAGTGISNTELAAGTPYIPAATELEYFTVYNSDKANWAMCESTVDINTVGAYYTPTLSDNILKQETGNGKSQVMSQKAVSDIINADKNTIEQLANRTSELETPFFVSPNIFDFTTVIDGMLSAQNGNVVASYTDYITSEYIPVNVGDVLHYQFDFGGKRYDSIVQSGYDSMTRVCAYTITKEFISGSGVANATSYIVPSNAGYIRVTFGKSQTITNRAVIVATTTDVVPFFPANEIVYVKKKYYKPKNNQYFSYKGSYSATIAFECLKSTVKCIQLSTVINFSSLPVFQIGIKNASSTFFSISVDSTKMYVYDSMFGSGTEVTREYEHGLTISEDLSVLTEFDNKGMVMITICSDGEKYSLTNRLSVTRAGLGFPYFTITSGSVDFVSFSASVREINMPVWIFGDSYLSDNEARWAYYLNSSESNNYMIDAYPGEGSLDSAASLENLLQIAKPTYLVWCIGMNDGTDNGAINTRWKTTLDHVKQLCDIYDVELIGATIPSVPSINHEYKNAYIRESGLKYIDFAKAVGASSSGVWFSGMLSTDNVHPTAKGAKALFYEAVTDFPQLLVKH